jgi:hypothetical protein
MSYTKVHHYILYCHLALLKYVTEDDTLRSKRVVRLYTYVIVVLHVLFAAMEGNLELSAAVCTYVYLLSYLLTH